MTTDRTREPPRTSSTELRLYAVAILAVVHLVAWRAIGTPSPTKTEALGEPPLPVAATPAPLPAAPAQRTVWLDELPAAQRPQVIVPAGWKIVAHTSSLAVTTPAPQPRVQLVRVPVSRPLRVRTRSS
jgi:hypothetical protein